MRPDADKIVWRASLSSVVIRLKPKRETVFVINPQIDNSPESNGMKCVPNIVRSLV